MSISRRLGLVAAIVVVAAAIGLARLSRASAMPAPATPAPPRVAPRWLRRLVTHRFNPLVTSLGLVGGRRSPWAYIEHVGRKSGRVYRTPVLPTIVGEFAYVPLAYGPDVDWARNVRTTGGCRIQVHETVYDLDTPVDIGAAEHPAVPGALRPFLGRTGRRYLRLHVTSTRPGRLDAASMPRTVAAPGSPRLPAR